MLTGVQAGLRRVSRSSSSQQAASQNAASSPGMAEYAVVAVADVLAGRCLVVRPPRPGPRPGLPAPHCRRSPSGWETETGRPRHSGAPGPHRVACRRKIASGSCVLQRAPLGAIAHHDQLQAALWITCSAVRRKQRLSSPRFFSGPAGQHESRRYRRCPGPSFRAGHRQRLAGWNSWLSTPRGEQCQALEAATFQLQALAGAGHQGQGRAVVEPAQVVGQQPAQQAQAVLAGVLLEIGVKAADHRDAQAPWPRAVPTSPAGLRWRCTSTSGRWRFQRRSSLCIDDWPHCRPG